MIVFVTSGSISVGHAVDERIAVLAIGDGVEIVDRRAIGFGEQI